MKKNEQSLLVASGLITQKCAMCCVVVVASAIAIGCNGSNENERAIVNKPVPKIVLLTHEGQEDFSDSIESAVKAHQSRNVSRYELEIARIKASEDLKAWFAEAESKKIKAIVYAPETIDVPQPLIDAVKYGLVVVNINTRLDQEKLKEEKVAIPFVGPDFVESAKTIAEAVAKKLEANNEVAVIIGTSPKSNSVVIGQQLEQDLKTQKMNLVAVKDIDQEQNPVETIDSLIIKKYPDLKAIFCTNDKLAVAAVKAVRNAKLQKEIKVIGFGNSASASAMVKNGSIFATVDLHPDRTGVYAIGKALEMIASGSKPDDQITKTDIVLNGVVQTPSENNETTESEKTKDVKNKKED